MASESHISLIIHKVNALQYYNIDRFNVHLVRQNESQLNSSGQSC